MRSQSLYGCVSLAVCSEGESPDSQSPSLYCASAKTKNLNVVLSQICDFLNVQWENNMIQQ